MKTLTEYMKKDANRVNEAFDLVPWADGYKDAMNPATCAAFKEAVLKVVANDILDNKAIMKRVQDWLKKEGYQNPSGNCKPDERAMNVVLSYVAAFVNALRNVTPSEAQKIDKAIRIVASKTCKSCQGVRM